MYAALAHEAEGAAADDLRSMMGPVWSGTDAYRGVIATKDIPEDLRPTTSNKSYSVSGRPSQRVTRD